MAENSPESPVDATKALEALVTHLVKLEAACRAVAAEIAGLRNDLADHRRGMPPRRRRPDGGSVPLRRR